MTTPPTEDSEHIPGRILLDADQHLREALSTLAERVGVLVGKLDVYLPKIDRIQSDVDEIKTDYGSRLTALETSWKAQQAQQERDLTITRIWLGALATVVAGIVIAIIVKVANLK